MYFFRILIAILIGTLLLTLVYTLPIAPIESNIIESAKLIEQEGTYPSLFPWCTSTLDNFTDSLMLGHAAYRGYYSPWVEAMKVHNYYMQSKMPDQELVDYYLHGVKYDFIDSYTQYWHGYLILLKPLLSLADFGTIRILNGFFQLFSTVFLLFLMVKAKLNKFILPYVLSVLCLMPLALAKCLQFSSCYYLMIWGSIAVIILYQKHSDYHSFSVLFLYIGIFLAYFDFLTYPILTFGIPFLFYLNLCDTINIRDSFRVFCKFLASWAIGYGGMWLGKLIIGTLITGENLFLRASGEVSFWLFSEKSFSLFEMFYGNIRDFAYTPFMILLVLYVFVYIFLVLRKNKRLFSTASLHIVFPYILTAILPLLWYCFLFKPSGIHHFFTNKALAVSAFAGASMLVKLMPEMTFSRDI